jgi:hypothetical protein
MLKWWVYFLIAIFIIDIIYRTFICKKINLNSIKIQNISGEIYDLDLPQNISKHNHVKYDKNLFDPNIMHFHSEKNNKKKFEYIEEEDEIIYPEKTKMVELDEDDIEFEGLIPKPQKRINVTIEYDEKYQNLYNELSRQLDGNISFLDFYPQIIYLQGGKKIMKYFLYISLAICFVIAFFIEKIINCCCNGMNEGIKGIISILKYFIFGLIYLVHMYLIKKITQTNLFEVYVDRNLKYSTIQKEEPPTYKILYNILRNIDNK